MDKASPIFVAGVPRSANTWMQVALSKHPRIHITGHPPQTVTPELRGFHTRRVEAGRLAGQWNKERAEDHFAGADRETCARAFAEYLRSVWTGYADQVKPRWGLKILWPKDIDLFTELWPAARWIVCVRHPWRVIESHKNTLSTKATPDQIARNWVRSIRFGLDSPAAMIWQIDRTFPESRVAKMVDLLRFVGEPLDATESPILQFAAEAPVVHKRTHKERGTWEIDNNTRARLLGIDGIPETAKQMGYTL